MAMLSEGGLTSPDIWVALVIILASLLSSILNPLVFRHNLFKKRSIARDLFLVLSATDFVSSILMSTTASIGILSPKEEQCIRDHNETFCQTDYYNYNRTAKPVEKGLGGVMWALVFIPMLTAATLAIARWYQISFPLNFFNRKMVEIALAVSCLCFLIYFQRFSLVDPPNNPVVLKMNLQIITYFRVDKFVDKLPVFLGLLFSSISNIASVLTVWKIVKSKTIQRNEQIRANRTKSTIKIAILNAGNIIWSGLVLFRLFTGYESNLIKISQTVLAIQPILQSTYNPIVYVLLTDKILKNSARVRAVN